MNARHPMGVLHSFSIKKNFYDKMDLRLFYFHETQCSVSLPRKTSENCKVSELFSGLKKGTLAQYGLKYQLKIIIENTLVHRKCLMLLFLLLL